MGLTRETQGGGEREFFKPTNYTNALAVVVQPLEGKRHNPDNMYEGKNQPRDEIDVRMAIFANSEDIENREPSRIIETCILVNEALVNQADRAHAAGDTIVARVRKAEGKRYYHFDGGAVDDETFTAVSEWFEADSEDVPDFND